MYSIIQSDFSKKTCEIVDVVKDNPHDCITKLVSSISTDYVEINNGTLFDLVKYTNQTRYCLMKGNYEYSLYKISVNKTAYGIGESINKYFGWHIVPLSPSVCDKLKIDHDAIISAFDGNHYQFFNFKLEDLVKNPRILVIGKRASGKSFLVKSVLQHLEKINPSKKDNMIVSPSEIFSDTYSSAGLNTKITHSITDNEYLQFVNSDNNHSNSNYVVFDDAISGIKGEMILAYNSFGKNLTWITTLNTPDRIASDIRLDLDYIFLLKDDNCTNIKKMWDNFANIFPSLESFQTVFSLMTKDYGCMVIDNRNPTGVPNEKVFWFKARAEYSCGASTNDSTDNSTTDEWDSCSEAELPSISE